MQPARRRGVPTPEFYFTRNFDNSRLVKAADPVRVREMRVFGAALTVLFSLIVTFANFDIVRILTNGGPIDQTHIFATWAFQLGIEGGDIPLGACVSLFMFPILGLAAFLILRDINKRGNAA